MRQKIILSLVTVSAIVFMAGCVATRVEDTSVSTPRAPTLTPTPTPQPQLEIASHTLKPASYGFREIVGEIKNNGNSGVGMASITATIYDKEDKVIDTGHGFTSTEIPAGGAAPFTVMFEDNPQYDHYKLQVGII